MNNGHAEQMPLHPTVSVESIADATLSRPRGLLSKLSTRLSVRREQPSVVVTEDSTEHFVDPMRSINDHIVEDFLTLDRSLPPESYSVVNMYSTAWMLYIEAQDRQDAPEADAQKKVAEQILATMDPATQAIAQHHALAYIQRYGINPTH